MPILIDAEAFEKYAWSNPDIEVDGEPYVSPFAAKNFAMNNPVLQNEWIPASKQMPPDEKFIIGYTPASNNMFIGYHREDWRDPKGKWVCLGPMGAPRVVTKKVTHWMWCPDLPEEKP